MLFNFLVSKLKYEAEVYVLSYVLNAILIWLPYNIKF